MMGRLSGKIALITGGARGMGATEARLFAREGAKVIIADVRDDEGAAVAKAIRDEGSAAVYHSLDVTSPDGWSWLIQRVENDFAALHVLVNNAGINIRYQLTEMDLRDWDKILAINLTGPMLGMRAAAPLIRASGGGSIVNIGSLAGLMGHPNAAYAASKWGLRGLSKSAALELVDWKIRVNTVHPGIIRTPIIDPNGPLFKVMVGQTPMERNGEAGEVAAAALFFASDESSFITGIDLAVDGGFSELSAYRTLWKASQSRAQRQPAERK